ncbi:unnamed protein product [Symbiodinium necroappetens]|uniref:Ubiquitin-like domain-containing protein n=1 Tax=Symbiodinium necroappetens TaxID=1628268 RepID=A0A812X0V7_9DINO|nr:unnamed protein product [Symbiodinium necroappetens]
MQALKAVRLWWQPVEASIRSRRVDLLQGALKEAHGESYLRTVYAVRRSASLDPVHRHSVEMEMAARLVKARAVLGKWQAGVEEIKKAHRARDVAGLAQALSRFQHSAEDAEVAFGESLDLSSAAAEELPKLLKDALERRDVPKLREAMSDMSKDGPKNIDGAEEAKKMIKRYQIRARALDHAVGERKISSIQAALATWDFSRDDVHAVKARQAIARRDQQKQKLQAAVLRKDGPHLQQVTQEWEFDRTDEDYQQAMAALRRYDKLVEDVERLMGPPMDIVALANVLDNWEWSKDDPVHLATEKKIAEHENAARNALQAKDGWKLQRIWQFNDVKKKGAAPSVLQQQMAGIKWKATVAKNRYREATHALREAIRAAVEEAEFMRTEAVQEVQVPGDEDALQAPQENVLMSLARFSTTGLPPKEYELRTLVDNWPFSLDDPTLQMASCWVASRALLKTCSLRYLDIALHGGHTVSITKALGRASAVAVPPRIYHKFIKLPENILRGKEEALMREATMQAVGAMSLGVEPDDLMMASAFAKELADKARLVRMAVSCVEAGRIPTLRAASKPPRVVHGIMETICHCVAGIHPVVRDPPRDTGWRTCQRMMNNPKVLIENLTSLPDWVASGRTEPIERAKAHWAKVQAEVGRQQDCTVEAVRRQSILAGQFLLFLEQTFGFYELLSLANVAPEKRRGAHAIARDADAQRLSDLQAIFVTLREEALSNPEFAGQPLWYYVLTKAKGSLASDMLFSAAWAVAGGSAEAVRECVERARLQVMEALAVTSVSNAVLSNLCRGLRPPQRETYVASEPRRSSKFLTQLNGAELGAKASLHRANKSIEASRAFKHNQTVAREVDVLIIRITGEEAALLHMPISSTVKDLQERLAAVESVPAQHQVLLFENKELTAHTPVKSLRRDRESVVFCTLYYKSEELVHRIEAAMLKIAQCSQLDLDMPSLLGGQLADPAICLIYGTSMFDTTVARPGGGERRQGGRRVAISVRKNETVKALGDMGAALPFEIPASPPRVLSPPIPTPTSPRKQSLQLTMMDILRTTTELVRGHAWGVPRTGQYSVQVDTPWQMQVVCEILELSTNLLKKPLVPQANLSTSLRLLQELEEAGLPASYQVEFIEQRRRSAAFLGSIPTTPGTPETKPGSRHSDRDRDLQFGRRDTSSESRRRDNTMDGPNFTRRETSRERDDALSWRRENAMQDSVSPPPVREADYQRGLHAVSAFVKAMKAMAEQGIPIVYPHVEYVRCAIDSAGLAFLNSPPAAEPAQRLRWAEGIMSVQLAPLPSFDQTLKRIARCIDEEQLAELAANAEPPENMQRGALGTGIERLFAALAWVLDPQCNCDRRWSQSRQLLLDAEGFAEELASWTSASAEPRRMNRAKQLLMEVWTWVGSGCSGVQALRTLFCWLTLAVAITPVAEQGARLRPVHSIIKTGLQRVDASPPAGRASAAAKAWTSVLFLLDSSAEAWWWLKGIRSSSQAPSPWTNSEDGGVGVANPMFGKPEDAWQQGEDPFDGNDPTAAALEFDRELDKEIDEVLKDDGGYAF